MKYIVILTYDGEEHVVGRYDTEEEAKTHLENVEFYPPHCRFLSRLHLDNDGWHGSGQDEDGGFYYDIEIEEDDE